jgi:hypothetical protein
MDDDTIYTWNIVNANACHHYAYTDLQSSFYIGDKNRYF